MTWPLYEPEPCPIPEDSDDPRDEDDEGDINDFGVNWHFHPNHAQFGVVRHIHCLADYL